jgi:hypothetical protein
VSFVGEILFYPAFSKYASSGHYLVSRGTIHDFSSPFSIRFYVQRLFNSVQLTGSICGEADRDLTGGDSVFDDWTATDIVLWAGDIQWASLGAALRHFPAARVIDRVWAIGCVVIDCVRSDTSTERCGFILSAAVQTGILVVASAFGGVAGAILVGKALSIASPWIDRACIWVCEKVAQLWKGDAGVGGIEFRPTIRFDSFWNTSFSRSDTHSFFIPLENSDDVFVILNKILLPGFKITSFPMLFETIVSELMNGMLLYDALPWVSLHFNQSGILYLIMNPFYRQTLTGHILGFLDYFMKGFVNGGFFPEEFVYNWHSTMCLDQQILKSNLIVVRQHLIQHGLSELKYQSIYEMGDMNFSDHKEQRCKSAFRIVGRLETDVPGDDSVLFPSCFFKVEYDIYPLPPLQDAIDSDPENREYADIKSLHEKMSEIIKTIMPKVPTFKGYFYLLRVITWAIHYVQLMSKSGRIPVVSRALRGRYVRTFPPYFPPLPVRSVVERDIEFSISDYFTHLQRSRDYRAITAGLNEYLLTQKLSNASDELLWKNAKELYMIHLQKAFGREQLAGRSDQELHIHEFQREFRSWSYLLCHFFFVISQKAIEDWAKILESSLPIKPVTVVSYPPADCVCIDDQLKFAANEIKRDWTELYRRLKTQTHEEEMKETQKQMEQIVSQARRSRVVRIALLEKQQAKLNQLDSEFRRNLTHEMRQLSHDLDDTLRLFGSLLTEIRHNPMQVLTRVIKVDMCTFKTSIKLSQVFVSDKQKALEICGGCRVSMTELLRFQCRHCDLELLNMTKKAIRNQSFIVPHRGSVLSISTTQCFLAGSFLARTISIDLNLLPILAQALNNRDVPTIKRSSRTDSSITGMSVNHVRAMMMGIESLDQMSLLSPDHYGCTPGFYACLTGNIRLVSQMLGRGISFGASPITTMTPLRLAIEQGNEALAVLLLQYPQLLGDLDCCNP